MDPYAGWRYGQSPEARTSEMEGSAARLEWSAGRWDTWTTTLNYDRIAAEKREQAARLRAEAAELRRKYGKENR